MLDKSVMCSVLSHQLRFTYRGNEKLMAQEVSGQLQSLTLEGQLGFQDENPF